VLESIFRFLFKYPPVVFQQGDLGWGVSRPLLLAIAVVLAVAVVALLTYRTTGGDQPLRERLVPMALRIGALAVLVICLFRPMLILRASVPQQNFVAVLVDDSRSMTIADTDGQPRSAFVGEQLATEPSGDLLKGLSDRFVLRFFKFGSAVDRVPSAADLKYDGTATRLGPALERARDELSGLPLAGVVMITDGADTSDTSLDEPLASLKARSIPVFPVGVGQESFSKDIQVTRVETPRAVLKGTALVVDVMLSQTGYSGQSVTLNVEDDGQIAATQSVTLPGDGESATARVRFTASSPGARLFRFRIAPQDGEQVTANNQRDALIEVRDRKEKVLYFEGEPRFEMKFINRAVEDDQNIELVVLQRTAENKYYRFGVTNPDELVTGFPKTREELFSYRALILGSIEAAAFSPEQLRMLADFANKRGGGLMMLGGRRAFAEGGWAGTPVGDVLPVVIDGAKQPSFFSEIQAQPTRAGSVFPVIQIGENEAASGTKWEEMPAVSTVNPISEIKPGATTLLSASNLGRQDQIVLAYQRYGRGKTIAMPIQDSWIWQMDAKVPVEDMTHEMFWRRMVRWLVDGVPDQVNVTTGTDRVEPGETVNLTAEVLDTAYVEVNDAHVEATITSPSGKTSTTLMEWTVEQDGEYGAVFNPDEPGLYEIRVAATRDQQQLGTSVMHLRVSAGDAEFYDAEMRAPLLRRIAEETGGRFFTPANAASLPEAISYSGRGVTVVEERELWDMPILLMLLLGLMGAEWAVRRSKGLA
jgi:uncharacterized membrane protein